VNYGDILKGILSYLVRWEIWYS